MTARLRTATILALILGIVSGPIILRGGFVMLLFWMIASLVNSFVACVVADRRRLAVGALANLTTTFSVIGFSALSQGLGTGSWWRWIAVGAFSVTVGVVVGHCVQDGATGVRQLLGVTCRGNPSTSDDAGSRPGLHRDV